MRFAVQHSAMNGSEAVLDALDAILKRAEDEVHEVEIVEADLLEESKWYKSSREGRKSALGRFAMTTFYQAPRTRGPHLRKIEVSDDASAARARHLANTPLLVLGENEDSDGALFEAALRVHAATQTTELCFGAPSKLTPPAFKIESRGGHGELPKLIAKRLAEAAARLCPHRLVVATDSDGEFPGEVKEHASNIRVLCADSKIPCPPLNKRTAENYIPDAIWREWMADRSRTGVKPGVEALLRLSIEQRDYVNMASPVESLISTKPEVAALFQDVSPDERDRLQPLKLKGKGDARLILVLKDRAASLTPADLNARDPQGDLLALVRHIEDEL